MLDLAIAASRMATNYADHQDQCDQHYNHHFNDHHCQHGQPCHGEHDLVWMVWLAKLIWLSIQTGAIIKCFGKQFFHESVSWSRWSNLQMILYLKNNSVMPCIKLLQNHSVKRCKKLFSETVQEIIQSNCARNQCTRRKQQRWMRHKTAMDIMYNVYNCRHKPSTGLIEKQMFDMRWQWWCLL